MQSLVEDVSALTTIPVTALNQLLDKAIYCICDGIEEARLKKENPVDIDLGIGILTVFVEDASVQYRFTPGRKLENAVRSVVVENKNPLTCIIEKTLTQKILNAYKQYL